MSKHIGAIGEKLTVEVVLVNDYSYVDYKYNWGGTTHYIYTMRDANGNEYVWKTTNHLVIVVPDNTSEWVAIHKGDTMQITGTVKEHSEYNGTKQTVLTRCKFSLVAHKPDKAKEQEQTIGENDIVWEMPYRQYKEHYADCETIINSYDRETGTIKVIIREGRLKNSGVRGKHFRGYAFMTDIGKTLCYRAVSEENAVKQMLKAHPDVKEWELYTIY
jgi:hypothetical protein